MFLGLSELVGSLQRSISVMRNLNGLSLAVQFHSSSFYRFNDASNSVSGYRCPLTWSVEEIDFLRTGQPEGNLERV